MEKDLISNQNFKINKKKLVNVKKDYLLITFSLFLIIFSFFINKSYEILYNSVYLYTIIVLMANLRKKMVISKSSFLVMFLLLIHTVIFGYFLSPQSVTSQVHDNAKNIILFLLIIFFTAKYVSDKSLWNEFLIFSQLPLSLFLIYSYITNFNGIAPLKFLPNFFGVGQRVRFNFGFTSYNSVAYYATAVVIISIIILSEKNKNKSKDKRKKYSIFEVYIFISILISLLVILSAQTKGALLTIAFFILISYFLNRGVFCGFNIKKINIFIWVLLLSIAIYIYGIYVLNSDSRNLNVVINLDIFKNYANHYTGLGYTAFSGFLTKVFGYQTYALDIYYLYIVFTTGYIGAAIILITLAYILIRFIKMYLSGKTTTLQNRIFALYIVTILNGFSESNVISPLSMGCYVYWILFMLMLLAGGKAFSSHKNNNTIKMERRYKKNGF